MRKLVYSIAIFALAGLYCLQSAGAVKDEPASQTGDALSSTFGGRDIFSPVAAHLAVETTGSRSARK